MKYRKTSQLFLYFIALFISINAHYLIEILFHMTTKSECIFNNRIYKIKNIECTNNN